ncbi:glycosyltransferase [Rhodococcoides corynebacterioides]|uniref:glycosyltransferase n=1 Tax=Rhodococcoides corynebacterioides TaxID=53972 RepID=UPI001C9A5EEC|nr:glycosyltransferase family 2 protein [Rhodococcus corynebacterioides]MBY6408745.1 glycosyltransferase [Rhodococcus corynebacterioides]
MYDRLVRIGSLAAAATAVLTVVNARTAPVIAPRRAAAAAREWDRAQEQERVTVCIPARDEAERLPDLLADLLAQRTAASLTVLVLDDDSTDGTADVARSTAAGDPRVRVATRRSDGADGVGKSMTCIDLGQRALEETDPTVVVFVDADVRLTPDALDAAVSCLRALDTTFLSPWPGQVAVTAAERLVQPLLSWSWSVSLYVRGANRGRRPSMGVANGQFLVMDAAAYRAVGGHRVTRGAVADDLTLVREFRRRGFPTAVGYGGRVATCRMYDDAAQVWAGHGKWLWSQFGRGPVAVGVGALVSAIWLIPPTGLLASSAITRRWAATGYVAGVVSRVVSRRAEGSPDSLARDVVTSSWHPASILVGTALAVSSDRGRRRGTLTWKSRVLDTRR